MKTKVEDYRVPAGISSDLTKWQTDVPALYRSRRATSDRLSN